MASTWINPFSAAWLMVESADTPMHVGALAIFSKPRNAPKEFLVDMANAMRASTDAQAPWSYRLSNSAQWALARRVSEVDSLDLDYHFRHVALPSPGGERELGVVVSRLHSQPLEHSKPLWEFHLIEGLANQRFAFYIKVHHALLDDVNIIPAVVSWLAESSRSRNMPPLWTLPLDNSGIDSADQDELLDSLFSPGSALSSLGKAAGGLLHAVRKPGKSRGILVPDTAPPSTLNRAINRQRRFATQQYQMARIEQLARATKSTPNVILTYLAGSALRRFFKEYNALPDESLIGAMLVSLKEKSERNPGAALTSIAVALGTNIGDPLRRLEAVKQSMQAVRKERLSLPENAATTYALLRSAPVIASQLPGIGRFVPPTFNLGISNTPGSDKPLYFNGARLEALYPMAQLMQHSALSLDVTNYAGTLNIGITGARDTLPHLQRLAVYMGNAVSDLEELLELDRSAA